MATVFTVGYKGVPVDELLEKVESVNGVLVDTRFRPYSPAPMWKKHALEAKFGPLAEGGRYLWLKGFGNENYQTPGMENVRLHDPEIASLGAAALVSKGFSPVLLCACTEPEHCHRSVAAEFFRGQFPNEGIEIVHWLWSDFPNGKMPKPERPRTIPSLTVPQQHTSMDPEADGAARKRGRRSGGAPLSKFSPETIDLFAQEREDDDIPF
jgi:hypothetical protein